VEFEENKYEIVRTAKLNAGKRRTYFFDVRRTKSEDYYITITENTKKFNGTGYERHKIFLYKEDFTRFVEKLNEAVDHIKSDLLPDYDFDHFARKEEEWENSNAAKENEDEEVSW